MAERIRILDRRLGEWLVANFGASLPAVDREKLQRLTQAISHAVALKHTCVDLAMYRYLGEPLLNDLLQGITEKDVQRLITDVLLPLVASADGQRIWLQKYHAFEQSVAAQLFALQQQNRLKLITGGPGTGKTFQAAKQIEKTLLENPACRILLAAPTGKAANNMMVALANANFDAAKHHLKGLTLHALLGMNGRSPKPRRDKNHPLSCDLLIVDEASMIDLPMMYRLLQALPTQATLLLLGDKNQLASVEAGSVLAEICNAFESSHYAGAPCIQRLTESRRYQHSPEIGVLAEALNAGQVPEMSANEKVIAHPLTAANPWEPAWMAQALAGYAWIADSLKNKNATAEDILGKQTQFQLLCALRDGPGGVKGINTMIAKKLGQKPDSWYAGQPVMITQNDHDRKLYNGDVGMVLPCADGLKACFMVNGNLKSISRAQMPAYETCYAITVHKSQGSEYDHVMIVLPSDVDAVKNSPVLTRELVYTAVTRAKTRIDLWAGSGVLAAAAAKTTQRMSGLQNLLSVGIFL
ncbi:MAG TPA: exodeoxyribonuclease V subunit alpha [Pseudomonadales bacterium]|nr:exodeoxyribonuclease V subunit alpha [Pseudomonadales bacterium]